ncbi:Protein phosphatase 1L [Entamoeba marina]
MLGDFLSTPLDCSSPRAAYSASPRSRKPAMYRGTPPTFTNTLRCVQSGSDVGLPDLSWSVNISHDGAITNDGTCPRNNLLVPLPRFALGISQTIGHRHDMEDIVCTAHFGHMKDVVCVFDGHNGKQAAEMAADLILSEIQNYTLLDDILFQDLFKHIQQRVIQKTESGTTAAIVYFGIENVKIASVGDCSVYLFGSDKSQKLTTPHKCGIIEEEKMIIERGGTIEEVSGIRRVNGILNITRSLGDSKLHPPLSFEPEIISVNMRKTYSHIVITSDGADTVSIHEMEKIVKRSPTTSIAASAIRNEAFKQKSSDNISVVVIDLKFSNYERKGSSPLIDDMCIVGDLDNPFD